MSAPRDPCVQSAFSDLRSLRFLLLKPNPFVCLVYFVGHRFDSALDVGNRRAARIFLRTPMNTPPAAPALSTTLIGTWQLLSREDRNAAGERRIDPGLGADPIALLYFDRQGHFAAQFMKRDRATAPEAESVSGAPNNSRARGGYDAYFGTYRVDAATGAVTTTLVGALSPENVGQVFTRMITVAGDELTIRLDTATPTGEPITRTLRWKRVG